MIFNGLKIEKRYDYQRKETVFTGMLNVKTERGDGLEIVITPELCVKLIELCADHIINVATETVEAMKAKVIEGLPSQKHITLDSCGGK